jgi:hypothetical protein
MSNRSNELRLYALEDMSQADKMVKFQASNADFLASGPQAMKFDFGSMQIKESGAYYNLSTRIGGIESDVSGNNTTLTASVAAVAANLAQEGVDRAAQDVVLGNQISSEIASRATAVQAVGDALDVQEAKQVADDAARIAAISAEASTRQTNDASEAAARAAADAALQLQITTLLGANTPAALQNLTAIVNAFQGTDATHTAQVASLVSRLDIVEGLLNELVNAGI